ncbi:hypothetical protein G4B88_025094, partial [Cannabis sativa]
MDTPDATMDDLLAKTNNLIVLDDDGWEIHTVGRTEVAPFCAMGRFCSNRPISRSLLRTILGRVWGIAEKDWEWRSNIPIKKQVSWSSPSNLLKNPWFLNNGLLIVERLAGIPLNWDKVLTKFPLSGRILQLPTRSITQGNLDRLAGFAGEIIEVQKADVTKIVTKGFFTFKVWCDISIPICPGFLFPIECRRIWLPFKYDRLPFMCFKCGFVGHDTRVCAKPVIMIEDGLRKQLSGYGAWLRVDERRGLSASPSQGSLGRGPTATPPGFPEKRASLFNTLFGDQGKNKAGGSSSMDRPKLLPRNMVNPVANPTIPRLEAVDKGKAINLADPSCLVITEQQVTQGKLNLDDRCGMEGMSEKMNTAKRGGSWRNEELNNSNYEHNLSAGLPYSCLQGSSMVTKLIDTENLLDVPISYANSCDSLKKIEGPSKRRKIVPKRSKNRRGNSSNEALSTDSILVRMKEEAKEISVVSNLTFAMNLEAANSA